MGATPGQEAAGRVTAGQMPSQDAYSALGYTKAFTVGDA